MNNHECPREPGTALIARVRLLVIVALLPIVAVAEDDGGYYMALAIFIVYIPCALLFMVLVTLALTLVPREKRTLALSLCFVPFAPVHNGSYFWPLVSYVLHSYDLQRASVLQSAAVSVPATAVASYVFVAIARALLRAIRAKT